MRIHKRVFRQRKQDPMAEASLRHKGPLHIGGTKLCKVREETSCTLYLDFY